ncbi:MAG: TonB-dependent receptor [Rhodospirillaceae bacterium]|nr:TonB-dependent receptor [Rhodospirillaceae bacterium]
MSTPRFLRFGVAAAGLCLTAAGAFAQDEIDTIVVTATRVAQSGFDLPVSISAMDGAAIREGQLAVNLSESLAAVPGLVVQNRENYAQDLQISSRGFGARATFGVRGLRVYVDGIPATMPDGQSQTSHIDLASAGRIEVLRGPFSALYGNSAGGVIAVFTENGPAGGAVDATVTGGSNGFLRASAKASGDTGTLNYVISGARFSTDGDRAHSAATRSDVNAKLRWTVAPGQEITAVVNGVDLPEAQDALGLTRAQLNADPHQAGTGAETFNTRKSVRQGQAGLTYAGDVGADDTVKGVLYLGRRTTVQYQAIPMASQTPATSPGGMIDLANDFWGIDANWTHQAMLGGVKLRITAGANLDVLDSKRRGYQNFIGATVGVRGALRRDENNIISDFDQYAQAEITPTERWMIQAGIRHSRVKVRSNDHYIVPGNGDDSGAKTYEGVNPVLGVTFKLSPAVNLYASFGRGLQTPTADELSYRSVNGTQTGPNFALKASRSDNYEAGVKARAHGVRLTAAVFRIATANEIVVQANSGGRSVFQNVAATTRDGVELGAEGALGAGFGFKTAYTYLDATVDQAFAACAGVPCVARSVPAGASLPGIPKHVGYGELSWRHAASGFTAAVELRTASKIYVDDFNSDAAPGRATANLRAGFVQEGESWEISETLRVDNLGGKAYVGSVIVNESNGRYFEPALGRSVYGGISARLSW